MKSCENLNAFSITLDEFESDMDNFVKIFLFENVLFLILLAIDKLEISQLVLKTVLGLSDF